ncbi:MAG: cation-translocating P-type ATPase [Rhodoferax sp.]
MSVDIAPTPAQGPATAGAFQLLDDPQEWGAFSRPYDAAPQCWESNLVVEGMHCAACALTIEDALRKVPGVISAHVGAASHRAKVIWSAQHVQPSRWMQAVQSAGYRPVPANDALAGEHRKKETRMALWRWLVAGLCMMQVMMYAYPAYSADPGDLSQEMEQLLRWASWVLSLPVMLFSCGPFFRNAWRDLSGLRISMDLPVALGMAITFAVSTAGTFDPQGIFGKEVYFDSLTMFVFFLLSGRFLELRLRDQTAGAIDALLNRLPESVERADGKGGFERVAARRVLPGDLLRVHPGESFVADGVVELGEALVDESILTGESHPVRRGPGASVLSGSHNLSATVQIRARAVGGDTRFAQIVALMDSAATSKPRSVLLADRLAKPFLLVVLFAAALAGAWWWGRDPGHALMVSVAVLVVTCPCALSLATPAALLAAAGALARRGILVRNLQALDALAGVDAVVFDKTGTLTQDAIGLHAVHVRGGLTRAEVLHMAAALAHHSLHPVSKALVRAAAADSDAMLWQCQGITETAGHGVQAVVSSIDSGGNQVARLLRLGSAEFCAVAAESVERLTVYLSDDKGWLATFELEESLRDGALQTVAALQTQGAQVFLCSGDAAAPVQHVAEQVGIPQFQAACTPAGKLDYLQQLQAQGRTVAMVGDGINDGPVLAGANLSFSLGHAAALTQTRSDFVILGGNIAGVAMTIDLAKRMRTVVRQNLSWALAYNAACVPLAVAGYLPAWLAGLGMATSSLLVVLNALRLTRFS